MKRILKSTLIAMTILGMTCPSLAGDNVRLKLKDGSTLRGETSDLVEVTYNKQGTVRTITGRIVKVKDLYLIVESEFGESPIFKSDLVSIGDTNMDESQTLEHDRKANRNIRTGSGSSERGATSRPSVNELGAVNPDVPGVFVLPLSGEVGVEFRHEEIDKFITEVNEHGVGQIGACGVVVE